MALCYFYPCRVALFLPRSWALEIGVHVHPQGLGQMAQVLSGGVSQVSTSVMARARPCSPAGGCQSSTIGGAQGRGTRNYLAWERWGRRCVESSQHSGAHCQGGKKKQLSASCEHTQGPKNDAKHSFPIRTCLRSAVSSLSFSPPLLAPPPPRTLWSSP